MDDKHIAVWERMVRDAYNHLEWSNSEESSAILAADAYIYKLHCDFVDKDISKYKYGEGFIEDEE